MVKENERGVNAFGTAAQKLLASTFLHRATEQSIVYLFSYLLICPALQANISRMMHHNAFFYLNSCLTLPLQFFLIICEPTL